MSHASFTRTLPGLWTAPITRCTPPATGLQTIGVGSAIRGLEATTVAARVALEIGKSKEPENCLHQFLDFLLDVLWRGEDIPVDKEVNFTVRMPNAVLRVACYIDESVFDLLARIAHIVAEGEHADMHAATLHMATSAGAPVRADTKLADLGPDNELVLGCALSEAIVRKCSDLFSSGGSPTGSTRSTRSSSGCSDELNDAEICSVSPPAATLSARFVDEPGLGQCVLLNNPSSHLLAQRRPEKLVCVMVF